MCALKGGGKKKKRHRTREPCTHLGSGLDCQGSGERRHHGLCTRIRYRKGPRHVRRRRRREHNRSPKLVLNHPGQKVVRDLDRSDSVALQVGANLVQRNGVEKTRQDETRVVEHKTHVDVGGRLGQLRNTGTWTYDIEARRRRLLLLLLRCSSTRSYLLDVPLPPEIHAHTSNLNVLVVRAERLDCLCQHAVFQSCHHDVDALSGQPLRDGEPDAAAASGHERPFGSISAQCGTDQGEIADLYSVDE